MDPILAIASKISLKSSSSRFVSLGFECIFFGELLNNRQRSYEIKDLLVPNVCTIDFN